MAVLVANPESVGFGTAIVGQSIPINVTLTNDGLEDVVISSVVLSDDVNFSTDLAPQTIPATEQINFTITFQPASATTFSELLNIFSDAVNNPVVILLAGEAIAGSGSTKLLSVDPTSWTFPSTKVGEDSDAKSFVITNVGEDPVSISSITVPTGFTLSTDPTPTTLTDPGDTATFGVKFSPVAQGYVSDNVEINSDADVDPVLVPVAGQGFLITPAYSLDGLIPPILMVALVDLTGLVSVLTNDLTPTYETIFDCEADGRLIKLHNFGRFAEDKTVKYFYFHFEDIGVLTVTITLMNQETGATESYVRTIGAGALPAERVLKDMFEVVMEGENIVTEFSREANAGGLSIIDYGFKYLPSEEQLGTFANPKTITPAYIVDFCREELVFAGITDAEAVSVALFDTANFDSETPAAMSNSILLPFASQQGLVPGFVYEKQTMRVRFHYEDYGEAVIKVKIGTMRGQLVEQDVSIGTPEANRCVFEGVADLAVTDEVIEIFFEQVSGPISLIDYTTQYEQKGDRRKDQPPLEDSLVGCDPPTALPPCIDQLVALCPTGEWTVGEESSITIEPTGGTAPYTFELVDAPVWLTVSEVTDTSITLTGTPAESGTFPYSVVITDSSEPPQIYQLNCEIVLAGISATCPVATWVVDEETTATIDPSGGVPPYHFELTDGPLWLSVDPDTGVLTGTPDEAGTFSYTVLITDSSEPPLEFELVCEIMVTEEPVTPTADLAYYIESSPRVDGLLTRYLYILPPSRDKLWRSVGPFVGNDPTDWGVWSEEAIPAGFFPRRIYGCNSGGFACGFADDARLITKGICTTPADEPWIEYPLPIAAKPTSGNPVIEPDPFWDPDLVGSVPAGYIGTDEIIYSQRTLGPAVCITNSTIGEGINELPAGVWNHILSRQNTGGDTYNGVLVIGVGTQIARWLNGDVAWSIKTCPDGDYKCSAVSYVSDTLVAVGIGADPIIVSYDYGDTWAAFTPPAGYEPREPRVTFDPNMTVSDTNGTFIITGVTVDGVEAIVLLPELNADDTLDTAVVAVIPSLPATVQLIACSVPVQTVGCVVVGFDSAIDPTDPLAVIILSNPEGINAGTPATYDDWHLMTLATGPFDGLT